jgi:hypothetical protein
MESSNCILSVALGYWYPKGQIRLIDSLNNVKWDGRIRSWTYWPNDNYDKSCPYNCKAAAFEEAIKSEYTKYLWLDCSFWALHNPQEIFDIIERDGYYFVDNGYNCAQTCSDACLKYFGITRDNAESMTDSASGIMGVDITHPLGAKFIQEFIKACKDGAAFGSRLHNNQSSDPRFLFHRQDQSVASLIVNKMNLKMHHWGDHISYDEGQKHDDNIILTLRGM